MPRGVKRVVTHDPEPVMEISSIPMHGPDPVAEPAVEEAISPPVMGAPPPGTELAMERAAAAEAAIRQRLMATVNNIDTSVPENPETIATADAERQVKFVAAVEAEIQRRRAFEMPTLPPWALCTMASADEIDGLIGLTFVSEDGEATRLCLTPDIMRALVEAGGGIAEKLDPHPSTISLVPFKLLRQESFVDDLGRHRMWRVGDTVTNRSEIALLESRGVPMLRVSPA